MFEDQECLLLWCGDMKWGLHVGNYNAVALPHITPASAVQLSAISS